jgi:hypothetical protein
VVKDRGGPKRFWIPVFTQTLTLFRPLPLRVCSFTNVLIPPPLLPPPLLCCLCCCRFRQVNGKTYANFDNVPGAVATFTDPQFLALTACVMNRAPVMKGDAFPLEYWVDYVKVYEWIR